MLSGSGSEERRTTVRHCTSCDMDIEICYQTFGNPSDPTIILVGGLNMQSYAWDEGFCEALVKKQFFVIRFDNRDIGHSTKIEVHSPLSTPTITTPGTVAAPSPNTALGNTVSGNTSHLGSSVYAASTHLHATHHFADASSSDGGGAGCAMRASHQRSTTMTTISNGASVGEPLDSPTHHKRSSQDPLVGSSSSAGATWRGAAGGLWKSCVRAARSGISKLFYMSRNPPYATSGLRMPPRYRKHQNHPRVPKVAPWKLLLPSYLACGEVIPYTLEDMALDALALLDVLQVDRAHVFGISMGGMIAQHMSLLAPHRVMTLTCIMSSTNAKDLPHPAWWVKLWLLRKPAANSSREQLVEFRAKALQGLLYGCVPVDEDYLKKRIALSLSRSSYAEGLLRQAAAIMRAPSRDDDLRRTIRFPCLIIHGQNDVLCRVEHGYRLAKVLTNSKFVVFKNMGHYLNPAYFDAIVDEFLDLVVRGSMHDAAERERLDHFHRKLNIASDRYEVFV